jgi:phage head-tail adaptor, putative, SPP1 family
MDSRRLNRKVTLRHLIDGQDEAGQPVQTWANLITEGDGKVAANVRYLSGVETIKANASTSVAKASILIRRRVNVTAAMRVVLDTTTFEIKTVLPDEVSKIYMTLVCEVITGGA